MQILLSHFSTIDELGGVQALVLRLGRALVARGHGVTIVETAAEARPPRRLDPGIAVTRIAAPSRLSATRPRSWASLARAAWRFDQARAAARADVVHVHFPVSQASMVATARRLRPAGRLVVTFHNSDIRTAPHADPSVRPWQRALIRQAEVVTTVSRSLLDDAVAVYPEIAPKGVVVYNGIGAEWFVERERRRAEPPFVLFAARLHPMKGADILLRAWARLAPGRPGLELHLAGDGEERAALERLAAECGVTGSVRFLGRLGQRELAERYQDAELVVLPSRREGLPLNLLEAAARSAICVATRVPGCSETIVHGETGLLVEPESPEALAEAMATVLDLPPARAEAMRRAARDWTRARFHEDAMVESYLRLYRGEPLDRPA